MSVEERCQRSESMEGQCGGIRCGDQQVVIREGVDTGMGFRGGEGLTLCSVEESTVMVSGVGGHTWDSGEEGQG